MVVSRAELMLIAAALLTQWNCVLGSPIQSVSVAASQSIQIKPCEPLYVILDVVISPNASRQSISEIPNELAADVNIDNENFHAEFNSTALNPVAGFGLIRPSVDMNAGGVRQCKVVAMMLWNFATNSCVFEDPGTYRVTFFDQASIDVTEEEKRKKRWEEKVSGRIMSFATEAHEETTVALRTNQHASQPPVLLAAPGNE